MQGSKGMQHSLKLTSCEDCFARKIHKPTLLHKNTHTTPIINIVKKENNNKSKFWLRQKKISINHYYNNNSRLMCNIMFVEMKQ